jgi:hypothetical protein
VLYSSSAVNVTLPITFANSTVIPKAAIVQNASISFKVTYLAAAVEILVVFTDDLGDIAGSVSVTVTSSGDISVDISSFYTELLQTYQQSFTIRAIHGSTLQVSLSVATPGVPVNLDQSSITSAITYSTVQTTPTPTPTTIATTTTPTTTTTATTTVSPLNMGIQTHTSILLLIFLLLIYSYHL